MRGIQQEQLEGGAAGPASTADGQAAADGSAGDKDQDAAVGKGTGGEYGGVDMGMGRRGPLQVFYWWAAGAVALLLLLLLSLLLISGSGSQRNDPANIIN